MRNVHGLLHRAFADAVRWRRLAVNPCDAADKPRKSEPEMKAWSSEQLATFISSTADDRLGGMWRLFSTTGMRRIALDDGTVSALRRWKRAQTEERLVMGAGWQGAEHDLVVTEPDGTPLHPKALTRRFHTATKDGGLPTIRLHDIRHSYATAALAAGVPVKVLSQRLGHADVAVTLRVYAHVLPGDDEAAAALVASVIGG